MKNKNINKNKKAFTLVELIIVITILAVLATIAFVSFKNYTNDARDANRISTLKNIEKGLNLYNIKTNSYPEPEEYVEIIGTGNILLSKQGIIGKEVAQKINLNKETLDPKDKTNYIYSITGNGKKFQLGAYLEDGKYISYFPQILKTYANIDYTNRYFYTIGDKVGIFLEDQTSNPILKTQSLTGINLETNPDNFKVIFSNDTQSGSVTSSGTDLIETIIKEQKTTQLIQTPKENQEIPEVTTFNCATPTPSGEGIATTIENATSTNQSWQKNATNCGFTCKTGYTGDTCDIKEVYGDEDTNAIAACNAWVTNNVTSGGEWIWVPARYFETDGVGTSLTDNYYKRTIEYNGKNYICKGFAVAKYEMSYDETTSRDSSGGTGRDTRAYNASKIPISMANRLPIVDITQSQAITQCSNIGAHLITNNERMAISRNIEHQPSNWSGNAVGNGYIDNGLDNKLSPNINGTIGCKDDDEIFADPTGAGACQSERQLTLSNGQKIWDLVGNVWEHVNKANTINGSNNNSSIISLSNICGGNNWYSWNNNETITPLAEGGVCNYQNGYTQEKYGPAGVTYTTDEGMGRIYSYEIANNIFLRGGHASNGIRAGLFTLYLNAIDSAYLYNAGFRCTY